MGLWQGRSKRKPSGGILRSNRKKKKSEIAREQTFTTVGKAKRLNMRVSGGNTKVRLLSGATISLTGKDGKVKAVKMLAVIENPANPHFVQRGFVTKGAVVQTEAGKARVTSRPGQHGTLSGVLIE